MAPALTSLEQRTLRMLRSRSAVFIDGNWRLKGAPAPRLSAFALSTLHGAGLLRLATPQVVMLSAAGRAQAEALIDYAQPARLARAGA
jgi:hypothetical protein